MATAFELVQEDILSVLRDYLEIESFGTPTELAWSAAPELTGSTGELVAVPWQVTGENAQGRFFGLPRGRNVRLRGVSLVDTRRAGDEIFYRFIDWSTMLHEQGIAVAMRPVELVSPDEWPEVPTDPGDLESQL